MRKVAIAATLLFFALVGIASAQQVVATNPVTGAATGAAAGAAQGAAVAGPIGALVGAPLGLAAGAVAGVRWVRSERLRAGLWVRPSGSLGWASTTAQRVTCPLRHRTPFPRTSRVWATANPQHQHLWPTRSP
jgi:hypothetical protein